MEEKNGKNIHKNLWRFFMRFQTRRNDKIRHFLQILSIVGLTAIASILLYSMYENIQVVPSGDKEIVGTKTSQENLQEVQNNSVQVADMVEKVTSCVVGISKIKDTGNTIFLSEGTSKLGLGSGVIVTENGYILSNEHVTGAKYSNCYVTLENGRTYTANVVWSDENLDLSICKINMKNLPYAILGDSANVRVGETVYAIGNPIGYEFQRTVTSGIISAVNRTIKVEETVQQNGKEEIKSSYMEDLIQTDATINKGNSGGPLINTNGEVIGITSVKITSAEGIGFAVPINSMKPIIESFQKQGKFEEASLGIFAYDKEIIPYVAPEIQLDKGIYVAQIALDSPASKTDLKVGDVIEKIDDLSLTKMCDLRCYIYTKKPGEQVNLTIYRDKKEQQIVVTLGKK